MRPSPFLARCIGLFLFLFLGAGVEWMLSEHSQEQAAGLKAKNELHGAKIRARLEGELQAILVASDSLAAYWAVRRELPGPDETRDLLAELYRRGRHVRSFAVATDYRIAQVFPSDGGGPAVGFDYRDQPKQWPLIQRGIASRSPWLAGPASPNLELAYGVPVFVDGQFRGLLSTLIDGPSLFAAAGLTQADEERQCALRTQAGEGAVLGADSLFDDPAASVTDIAVPGGAWRLAVKSTAASASAGWPALLRGLGWLLAGLFATQSAALLTLNRKLSDLALYDRLTGLPSRHLFLDRLKQMIRRTKRNKGNFSVLFVSLDGFKAINAAQGEKAGDMMLAGIGKRLLSAIRHCDTVTRWGGDEFLVLLDACPLDQARLIAENLRHKIELPVPYGKAELRAGASIGLATYPEDGHSLAALLKAATAQMLKDKGGRKT